MTPPTGIDVTRYRPGDVLWHGTSYPNGFADLKGPMWVSNSHAVASWFSTWRFTEGDEGVPRVHKYVVTEPFDVPVFNIYDRRMKAVLDDAPMHQTLFLSWANYVLDQTMEIDPSELSDIEWLANAFCDAGYAGWRLVQNYDSGDDIMVCDPARYLRRVQAGAQRRPR